ncbi:hypothetical protein G7054_g10564 [Neopestalotiopsis clavispora]|nr:hypothetical protein G7054_g10564 [Neopestalotiopsis clavispora]
MKFLLNFLVLCILALSSAAAPLRPQSPPTANSQIVARDKTHFTTAPAVVEDTTTMESATTTWDNDDGEGSEEAPQDEDEEDSWEEVESHVDNDSDPWDPDTFVAGPSSSETDYTVELRDERNPKGNWKPAVKERDEALPKGEWKAGLFGKRF